MRLSIIIPTFNEEKLLPILLRSIRSQSFTDYEIIVADNASTDKTRQIAENHGATIVSGGLPGKSRNAGANDARGDTLLFLDADVILTPSFLQDTLTEFDEGRYGIATCQILALSNRKVDLIMHWLYSWLIIITAHIRPFAPGFCIFANRKINEFLGGFDEEIMLGEDSDYACRASKVAKFGVLRSHKVQTSVRRFDRDGRLNVVVKYFLSGLYMLFIGKIKTNIFNYTFGHEEDNNDIT